MTISALLFDLDGTMVDTDALHIAAYNDLLERVGRVMDAGYYKAHVMGAPNDAIMQKLFPNGTSTEHDEFVSAKEARFRASVGSLAPMPGLLAILDWADANQIARAVVTNAPRDNAELMLRAIGVRDRFAHLVIGDELARGKPDPLPYLTGLRLTGSTAEEALAFEDSLSGVRAAAAAGIETIGLLTSLSEQTLRDAGANHVAHNFEDERFWKAIDAKANPGRIVK